jgi:SAM-dependent methyltransferase
VGAQAFTDYDAWHDNQAEDDAHPTATAPWHLLALRHLDGIAGLRVLEIGCGRGAFAEELAARGASVTAADFSAKAVEDTRARLDGSIRVLQADIQRLPFQDGVFDLVVSLETLEHVPEPNRALAELVRVTRHGGRLLVTTPSHLNAVGLYRVYLRMRRRRYTEGGQPINQPIMLHSRVRRLRKLGCRVDLVEGYPHPSLNFGPLEQLPGAKWLGYQTLTLAERL